MLEPFIPSFPTGKLKCAEHAFYLAAGDLAHCSNKVEHLVNVNYGKGYFLYKITDRQSGRCMIKGVVGAVPINEKIYPHEQTLPTKVEGMVKALQGLKVQHTPIMITGRITEDIQFGAHVEENLIVATTDNTDTFIHEIWSLTSEFQYSLNLYFSKMKKLFILDGHHRYEALKQLSVNKMMCLYVPYTSPRFCPVARVFSFSDGAVESFIEQYIYSEGNSIAKKAGFIFNTSFDYEVVSYNGNSYIYTRKQLSGSGAILLERIEKNHSPSKYFRQSLMNCNKEFSTLPMNSVLFQPRHISYDWLFDQAERGIRMQPHLTCFDPKPMSLLIYYELFL